MSKIRLHVEILVDPTATSRTVAAVAAIPSPILLSDQVETTTVAAVTTIPTPGLVWRPTVIITVAAVAAIPAPAITTTARSSDSGTGHEATALSETVTSSDTGTGTDSDTTPAEPLSNADTGTATDNGSVTEISTAPSAPRWTFASGTTEITFEINPSETNEISRTKELIYQNTLAPQMKSVIYAGSDAGRTFSWSGTTLTQAQYEMFMEWYDLEEEIQLMDDLGRVLTIYITDLQPKRERSIEFPWKHSYRMEAVVLSEA